MKKLSLSIVFILSVILSFGQVRTITGTGTTGIYPKFTGSTTIGNALLKDSTSTWTVAKNIRIDGLKMPAGAGAAKVLTSDANGVASWAAASSSLTGATGDLISFSATDTKSNISASTANFVLTSNGTSTLPSWKAITTSAWGLTGNSGTTPGTNFIGTTDKQDLVFKINGVQCGRINRQGINAVDTLPASIYLGAKAGAAITTGSGNAMFGYLAAEAMTSGYNNTGIGDEVLRFCVDCYSNTALGHEALMKTTSGAGNTAISYQSLYNNTSGGQNIASGHMSLWTNTTGSYNISRGFQNMYLANAVNGHNISDGYQALYRTTASNGNNIARGYQALFMSTSATYNIADGPNCMYSNTSGSFNVGAGYNNLYSITTGSSNAAYGVQSLGFLTTGRSNAAIGRQSLANMTTSSGCAAIGDSAGAVNLTGSYNTYLGWNANPIANNLTNATAIGAGSIVDASNTVMIGKNANVTVSNSGGALATTATSGFFYIPSCAGVPTGVPSYLPTGGLPMVYDSTNQHLYIYVGGAWVIVN